MIVTVDTTSGVPPYEQVRAQIMRMIASGVLVPGARLPTIAQLASDLALAPGTVARSYKELERDRLIVSTRRRGSFVAEHPDVGALSEHETDGEIEAAIEAFVLQVRQLGADPAAVTTRVRAALLDGDRP